MQHCVCLITFTQLLLGAIASIWFGYYTEMSARSRFSQQVAEQSTQQQAPSATTVQFSEKEKTYFAMYDTCAAWLSFLAVLPFLTVISWASAVVFVAKTV
jgi:hypothetical protein